MASFLGSLLHTSLCAVHSRIEGEWGGRGVAPTFDNGFYGAHSPRAGARNYRSYNLRDEITWNRNPPTAPPQIKYEVARREKRAIFHP